MNLSLLIRLMDMLFKSIKRKDPLQSFTAKWSLFLSEPGITEVQFSSSFKLPFFLRVFARQSTIDAMGDKFLSAFAEQLSK